MSLISKNSLFVKILPVFYLLFLTNKITAQTDREFWFSVPEINRYHTGGSDANHATKGGPTYLRMTAGGLSSTVTITMPANSANFNGGVPYVVTIPANTTKTLDLQALGFVGDDNFTAPYGEHPLTSMENRLLWTTSNAVGAIKKVNQNNKGVNIKATTPITAYYEISSKANMELIAFKGKNALGTDFYIPFQTTYPTSNQYNAYTYTPYSSFDIVATGDNTEIEITPTQQVFLFPNSTLPITTPFRIRLNKGETAIIPPYGAENAGKTYKTSYANRLAGSYVHVVSGDPIAIITRDDLVKAPSGNVDFVGDQIVPFPLLNLDYAVVRGQLASAEEYVYVLATQNNTNVTVNGVLSAPVLNAGKTRAFQIPSANKITTIHSDLPVYVFHLSGFTDGGATQFAGAMIPTITVCTGSSQVAFNRTKANVPGIGYYNFYINILVRDGAETHFTITDKTGADATALIPTLNTPASYTLVGATAPFNKWRYASFLANSIVSGADEAYMIKNSEDVFHLGILNGYGGYDAFYGYFSDFNEFNPSSYVVGTGSAGVKECYGSDIQLYASGGTHYSWSPTDFLDNPLSNLPKAIHAIYPVDYKVTISGSCGFSADRIVKMIISDYVSPAFTSDKFNSCASKVNPLDLLEVPKSTFTFTNGSVGDYYRTWYYRTYNKVTHVMGAWTQFKIGNDGDPDPARVVTYDFPNNTSDTIRYHLMLEVADDQQICFKTVMSSIVVYPFLYVSPTIDYGLNTNHCQPLTANFHSNPLGASATASYNWDFGDLGSSSAQDPVHIYNNLSNLAINPTATVVLTDQWNNCKSTGTVSVNIAPYVKASFVVNQIEGCSPFSINITNDSKGGISNYSWYLDGVLKYSGPSAVPPVSIGAPFLFTNVKTDNTKKDYIIKLVVQNSSGCIDSTKRTISVYPKPSATISMTNLSDVNCSPLSVQFNAASEVNTDVRHWYVGGNAIGNTASVTYPFDNFTGSSFTKSVTYVSSNTWGCTYTPAALTVTVQPYVEAVIIADKEEGCPDPISGNFRVNLTNASVLATGGSFQWNIDGVDRPLNAPVTFVDFQNFTAAPVTKAIKLTVKNSAGCTSVDIVNIKINPQVTASYTASVGGVPITPASVLCSPVTVVFDGTYTNATTYSWQFGDLGAATTQDPTFTLYNDGAVAKPVIVTVTATNPSGCFATATKTYNVQPEITAEFSLSNAAGCVPLTVEVHAPVNPAATYSWTFNGNPYSGDSPILPGITANKTGVNQTYPITLTAALGICTATSSKNVVVYPEVEAKWDLATPFAAQCSPASLTLNNLSDYYNATPVTSILWENLTSGGSLIESSSSNTFTTQFVNDGYETPKAFKVRLTATSVDGCKSVKEEPINVNPPVVAAFDVDVLQACNPMQLKFTDKSLVKTGTSPTWSFGGGSSVEGPPKTWTCDYSIAGPTTVSLTYTNSYTCTNTKTYNFTVPDKVVAAIGAIPLDRLCAPGDITFTNASTGGATNYLWDFGDGTNLVKLDAGSVTHRFENRNIGLETRYVKLTANNTAGCSNTSPAFGLPIYVYPEVDAIQSFTVDNVCAPIKQTEVNLTNSSLNGSIFTWNFTPDNAGGTAKTITPSSAGFPKVVLANTNNDANVTYTVGFNARTVWNPGLANEITCQDNAVGDPIVVAPNIVPSFTGVAPLAVCSGGEMTFNDNGTRGGNMTLVWNFGDGESASSVKGANVKHIYYNYTLADLTPTAVVTATQTSTGCTNTWSQTVRVHPYVKADFAFDIPDYCIYPLKVDFTNGSIVSTAGGVTTNYAWDYGYTWGGVPQNENRPNKTAHSYNFYNATANTDANYTIKLTASQLHAISGLTCSDDTTRPITVIPELLPQISIPAGADYGCSDYTLTFNNASTGGTMNFLWDFANGNSAVTNNVAQTVTQTFEYRGVDPSLPTPSLYPVKLTATNSKGCVKETTQNINVYPKVEANFTMAHDSVCTPFDVIFTNTSLNGQTFHWDYGYTLGGVNQEYNSSRPSLTHRYTFDNESSDAIKNYTITLNAKTVYAAHTCQSTINKPIAVYPRVITNMFPTPTVGCSDHVVTFDNLSTGGVLNFSWNFGDGQSINSANRDDVTHTFINRGPVDSVRSVLVTSTNPNGCKYKKRYNITTHPKVEAAFTFAYQSLCTPFNIDLSNSGLNGNKFTWDFGYGGFTAIKKNKNTFAYPFDNPTANNILTYTIQLTSLDSITGCSDVTNHQVTVYPRVVSQFTTDKIIGCNPLTVQFTNLSTGLATYSWAFGDGNISTAVSPSKVYSHADKTRFIDYNVRLTSTNINGCQSTKDAVIRVNPLVKAMFQVDKVDGCTPLTVSITNSSTSLLYSYNWSFGDGRATTVEQPTSITYTNATLTPPIIQNPIIQLTTSYTGDATCSDVVSVPLQVYPHVYPDFTISNTVDCTPLITNITNNTVSFSNATEYAWSLGDGTISSLENLSNLRYRNTSATRDTVFNIKLVARSVHQCFDEKTKSVTVHPRPVASYSMGNESLSCSPFPVTINNTSLGRAPMSYTFNMGDGTTFNTTDRSQVINHTYHNLTSEVQPYIISLDATTEFGCQNSISQTIYSYPEVTAKFSINPGNASCNPFSVSLNNASTNAYFYQWRFDDGLNSTMMSPTHRFVNVSENDKTFYVNLKSISEYDCVDDTTLPITVYATPIANFSVNPPLKVYPNATFNFHNQSNPAAADWSYTWTFGDGYTSSVKEVGDHTYTTWGPKSNGFVYRTTLKIATPHCSDSTFNLIQLLPAEPISEFSADLYKSCSPLESHFLNKSRYGSSYLWDFGDGTTSTLEEPIHIFTEPGYYNVTLKVTGDGGEKYFYRPFRVFKNPEADFAVFPLRVMLPDANVHVYNLTKYADRYEWDLGDGTLSTDKDPVHKYEKIGEFRISLRAFAPDSLGSCQDYTTKFPAVWVEGTGKVTFPNAFVPNKNGSNGGLYDDIDYKNEVFHPLHYGVVEYKLMIFNRWGEQIFQSNDIKVGWDGYFQGKICDQGVYIWRAIGKFTNGRAFDQKGNVTLLR